MFEIKPIDHELEKKRQWFKARDILFGENGYERDLPKALKLMQTIDHEDARWLCSIFPDPAIVTPDFAKVKFMSMMENDKDPRIELYYLCTKLNRLRIPGYGVDAENIMEMEIAALKRLADEGNPLAGLRLMRTSRRFEAMHDGWLERAFKAGEPEAYFTIAHLKAAYPSSDPAVNEASRLQAIAYFQLAGNLGYFKAWWDLSNYFDDDDPLRYYYRGRAAVQIGGFELRNFIESCNRLFTYERYKTVDVCRYRIGEVLSKHLNCTDYSIQGHKLDAIEYERISLSCKLYKAWCRACRRAIDYWTLIGIRNQIPKDIRLAVARWLWEKRSDADYPIDTN